MTLATPIPHIELALEGRGDMLRAIFGGSDPKKQAPVLTPEAFDAVFGAARAT